VGTRHLIAVYAGGQYKVAQYGQWDGYPTGQGNGILQELRKHGVGKLRRGASQVAFATQEQLDALDVQLQDYIKQNPKDNNPLKSKFPEFSRDTSSDLLGMMAELQPGQQMLLKDELEFAADPLFCEWAYVLDLDAETLEIYSGGATTEPGQRFYELRQRDPSLTTAVQLLRTFKLDALPESFDQLEKELNALDEAAEEATEQED
jgi:hypothetical protein